MMATDKGAEDDSDLLHRIVRRDPQGVAQLYDRYGGMAFALAYRIFGDHGAAEEIVQEAFLNVWRHAHTYDAKRGTVRTWLLTVVHHQTITLLRAARSRGGGAVDIDSMLSLAGADDIAATVERGLEGERVRAALATLPPDQRQAVVLAYFGGLSHSEIAARISLPLGTVKSRIRLGLEKLRASLRQSEVGAAQPIGD